MLRKAHTTPLFVVRSLEHYLMEEELEEEDEGEEAEDDEDMGDDGEEGSGETTAFAASMEDGPDVHSGSTARAAPEQDPQPATSTPALRRSGRKRLASSMEPERPAQA